MNVNDTEWEALRDQAISLEVAKLDLAAYIEETILWCDENIARIKGAIA